MAAELKEKGLPDAKARPPREALDQMMEELK